MQGYVVLQNKKKHMNYIEMINNFWQVRRTAKITSTEADLYYFLLQESNQRNWENPFGCSNAMVCAVLGLSERTMTEARTRLQEKGLIGYTPGIRSIKTPTYELLSRKNTAKNKGSGEGRKACTTGGTDDSSNRCLLDKTETETETEKKGEEESTTRETINSPFGSKKFIAAWDSLLRMPKWENRPARSLQLTLDKLSEFDEAFATELVEQAISGDWMGVVFADTRAKYDKWRVAGNRTGAPKPPVPAAGGNYKNTL